MASTWDKYKKFEDIRDEPSLIKYHADRFAQGARDLLAKQAFQHLMMEEAKKKNV